MLVGGIKVIGIYIWATESSFKNSTLILLQVLFFFLSRLEFRMVHCKFDELVMNPKG